MTRMFGRVALASASNISRAIDASGSKGEAVVDMEAAFLSFGLDVIGLGVFNFDFGSVTAESPVIKAVYGVLKDAEHRSTFYIPYWNLPLSGVLVPRQRRFRADLAVINECLDDLIEGERDGFKISVFVFSFERKEKRERERDRERAKASERARREKKKEAKRAKTKKVFRRRKKKTHPFLFSTSSSNSPPQKKPKNETPKAPEPPATSRTRRPSPRATTAPRSRTRRCCASSSTRAVPTWATASCATT